MDKSMIAGINYLKFRSSTCRFEIFLNDVLLFEQDSDGTSSTKIPLNHLLLNGVNTLKLIIAATDDIELTENSKLEVFLELIDAKFQNEGEQKPFLTLSKADDQNTSFQISGEFIYAGTLLADCPWLNVSPKNLLQKERNAIEELLMITKAFREMDVNEILRLSDFKDKWYASSYGFSFPERIKLIRNKYIGLFDNPNFSFNAANPASWIRRNAAFGKLLNYYLPNGNSPVHFTNTEEEAEIDIPIYLTLVDNDIKWVL
jgi:hypothetical protein